MYKINFKTESGQQGSVYVAASSDNAAISKAKAFLKELLKQEIQIGLISFQLSDIFVELDT